MNDETKTSQDGADETRREDAPTETARPSVEELTAALEATRDQMLRAVAEADNTRKRAEREIAESRIYAVAAFARDLLSVSDNLARALDALTQEVRAGLGEAARHLVEGVEITQKDLRATLQRHGVRPMAVEPGAPFDPNLHQAAAQIPSDRPAGVVVEVMQDGWVIGERVLRAATVAVSAGRASAPQPGAQPGAQIDTKV